MFDHYYPLGSNVKDEEIDDGEEQYMKDNNVPDSK